MPCCGKFSARKCGCCVGSSQKMAGEQQKQNQSNPCIGKMPPTKPLRVAQGSRESRLKPRGPVKVTLDGKVVPSRIEYVEEHIFPEYPPPPWVRPRLNSRELRGGVFFSGCDCFKKNGLQDDCPRKECLGRPMCMTKPDPMCDNSRFSPSLGMHIPYRNPNEYY